MRYKLKSILQRSSSVQNAYSWFLYHRAKARFRQKRYYESLDLVCTALRRVSDPRATDAHWRLLRRIKDTACLPGVGENPGENLLMKSFLASKEAEDIRADFQKEPLEDRIRLRRHRDDNDPGRQGNMMILKAPPPDSGEKGVIVLTYNDTFAQLPAVFDLPAILRDYQIVLEPSYSRNFLPSLFLYAQPEGEIVFTSALQDDRDFLLKSKLEFSCISLGASDWADPDLFAPIQDKDRKYDVVMVASWSQIKRHDILFQSLAHIMPRRLRAALVGYNLDLTIKDIKSLARKYGVADQCDFYESIPSDEVARIVADSKVALHLSKKEGTNKATYEALFCNTPLIVYRHNVGFPMSSINNDTGMLADDSELPAALTWMVDHYREFNPRRWALANTGYRRATQTLNDALRDLAVSRRRTWSRDIVPKVNRPNLRYKHDEDRIAMEPAYQELLRYLR